MATLECLPENAITVRSALFGRRVPGSVLCLHETNYGANLKTDCDTSADQDTAKVQQLCNNRTSCNVEAEPSVFGDPCYGTSKYLRITYSCNQNNPMALSGGMLPLTPLSLILSRGYF